MLVSFLHTFVLALSTRLLSAAPDPHNSTPTINVQIVSEESKLSRGRHPPSGG